MTTVYSFELKMSSDQLYGNVNLVIKGLDKGSVTSVSNSNIFSETNSFGSYKYKSIFKEEKKRLKKIENRLNDLKQTFLLAGKTIIDVFPIQRHDFYIEFNGHVISSKNPYFKELKEVIEDIFLSKNKDSLFEVTLVDSQLIILKNGKTKKSIFDKEENCSGSAKSGVCKIKDLGFISI